MENFWVLLNTLLTNVQEFFDWYLSTNLMYETLDAGYDVILYTVLRTAPVIAGYLAYFLGAVG